MAGFDAHKNLAISAVATAPTPATSGTTLVVKAGEGARFDVPANATVWPSSASPTPLNAEVIRVTARTTDTLTIVRAQEGSTARAIGSGDLIAQTITAKTLTDLETRAALKDEANTFTAVNPITLDYPNFSALIFKDTYQPVDARIFRVVSQGQILAVDCVNDAATVLQGKPLQITRLGDVYIGRDVYEKGRATPMGHWTQIAFNPANFSAMPSGTLTITAALTNRYTLIGKTMLWNFYISMQIGGAPTYLRMAFPPGLQASSIEYGASTFLYGTLPGMAQTAPGDLYLNLYRDATGATAFPIGTAYAVGTAIIPIL